MTTTSTELTEPRTARHPLSIGHLVMGVAFAGLTVVWALVAGDVVEGRDVRFLLPAPWVLAGAAGLIALVVTDRRRHGTRATGWVGQEEEREPADASDDGSGDDTTPPGTMGA